MHDWLAEPVSRVRNVSAIKQMRILAHSIQKDIKDFDTIGPPQSPWCCNQKFGVGLVLPSLMIAVLPT
jgi:hypothetical protein